MRWLGDRGTRVLAERHEPTPHMPALIEDFADAALIDAERLRDVVLLFTEEVPLPHLDGVVERQR
ncbi:MAG: hypothetical protein QOI12_2133 [Alphaproteobacteria bacterium]|nr:hypothetical protein [Alphaproteobacteria bacterium]